jgi:hypothetical protein
VGIHLSLRGYRNGSIYIYIYIYIYLKAISTCWGPEEQCRHFSEHVDIRTMRFWKRQSNKKRKPHKLNKHKHYYSFLVIIN